MKLEAETVCQAAQGRECRLVLAGFEPRDRRLTDAEDSSKLALRQAMLCAVADDLVRNAASEGPLMLAELER